MSDGPSHKLDELTAYFYGEGTPRERAEFERHLADCPDCQASLARMRELIPQINQRLRQPVDTSVDGMMRIMERAERDLKAGGLEREPSRSPWRPWILTAAVIVIVAAAVAFNVMLIRASRNRGQDIYAPERPTADGG